jgi:hypothetical protein
MRSKILLITILAAPVCLGQVFISLTSSQTRDRQGQEIAALRLLGKAGKGKFNNTCSSLSAGLGTQATIRKWLEQKDYADQLHETAKRLAEQGADCTVQTIYFPIEQPAPIEKVVELLGKEISTKSGEVTLHDQTIQLTWYEYGWLAFGVQSGKVTVVQIDFKKTP